MIKDFSHVATSAEGGVQTLHVAVVHTVGAICLVTAASSRPALTRRLADYVRRRASDQLWPPDAHRLRMLLDGGQFDRAVELYFSSDSWRWDQEWLVTEHVRVQ